MSEGTPEIPLPTRMGEENKEFVAGLSETEKEETKSRHRSIAQLEGHGAEVTEEGRLEVTPEQIERVRKMMDKNFAERGEVVPPSGEKILAATAGMSLRIEAAMGRASERVIPLAERGKELWGRAADRIKAQVREVNPREFVASLVDLPARFTGWAAERAIRRVEELKEKRDADVKVFIDETHRLIDEANERIESMLEALLGRKDALNAEVGDRKSALEEKYGVLPKVLPESIEQSRDQELEALQREEQERVAELKQKFANFHAQEKQQLDDDRDALQERFEKYVPPIFARIGDAIEQRETWVLRARRAGEASQRVRGFLGAKV